MGSFYKPFLSRTLHPHHLSRHKRVYSSASIFCNLAIPLATNKMSEIPKKQTQTAPTPQNTPANNAPISSHAQAPSRCRSQGRPKGAFKARGRIPGGGFGAGEEILCQIYPALPKASYHY